MSRGETPLLAGEVGIVGEVVQQSEQIIPLLNSCMTSVCTYLVSVANFKLLKCKEMCPELKTKTRPKTVKNSAPGFRTLQSNDIMVANVLLFLFFKSMT